ncbi:uncharacterized protein GGS22DRAFT_13870 [Annulohypoxylon maeteangense]|uniref:uncharacterized protein n=1 Tax=Annulohypoxylon maeteangense TaxID=1927788 RepID=UPI0020072FE9|nr:uncharacterized protein GGS22DRAFT_13870 [Annulohypoxylon maeteangense]KAI0890460.1 hypothetical protein GGS22DRAFT_13870 [Annulohypoxylon maeteangense]
MESLRHQARDLFLRRVSTVSTPDWNVIEISGSGNDIVYSKKSMATSEVRNYLRADSTQPTFRLIRFKTQVWSKFRKECVDLAWVLDMLTELDIEIYGLLSFLRMIPEFHTTERNLAKGEEVLNIVSYLCENGIAASYNKSTRSTTCFFFERNTPAGGTRSREISKCLEQNARLYRNIHFLPFIFMSVSMKSIIIHLPGYTNVNYEAINVDNLLDWGSARFRLRRAHGELHLVLDIVKYVLDMSARQESSDTLPQDIADDYQDIKNAAEMIGSRIPRTQYHIEWQLQKNQDHLDRISRGLMREDTIASIELAKSSVELTKAAKIDSSSMKVIAVMTMVFLPGTFFATLFAVPSLKWDQDDVVGKDFWMYWAFTIPFTVLVIILWLVITQRRQMRSVFDKSREQWLARADALRNRVRKRNAVDEEEEVELEDV